MPLAEGLPGASRTCGTKTTCAPVCHRAERSRDSPSGAIIMLKDTKHSFDEVETRRARRNEKQRYLDRICKNSNASEMVQCHVVQ
jgi:hypothetical protein